MKRTLIALALALGTTAAFAEATLDIQGSKDAATTSFSNVAGYRQAGIVDDDAPSYPLVP